MSTLIFCFLIISPITLVSSVENKGCPYHSEEQTSKSKIRGHQEPFGYHAKQWKRIETLYEHPHPEVFYEKYMRASKPVIIRGGAKEWPAIKKWTNLTYLNYQARFGRPDINWKKMYSYDPYHPVRVRMTMREFTRDFNDHSLYMDSTLPKEIADDVHWPKSLGCKFYQKRTKQLAIMFNNGKSSSDLHMDSTCTYFVQVTGSRRWLLTPPTQVENVYSGDPSLIDHLGISIVNQNSVDLEKHNRVKDLTIYGAIMDPGDIIYVPEGWHHQVKTYNSPNIGVVVFMNYLLCEFHSNSDDADVDHVKKCVYKIREQRPKTLKCDPFPEDNIPIPQLLKDHPPPAPDVFMQHFRRSTIDFGVSYRRMKSGEEISPMGISLVNYDGKIKEKIKVLNLAIIEGFRMFCVSTSDKSPLLVGTFIKKRLKNMRKIITVVAYLQKSDFGRHKAQKAIDKLLNNLNSTYVDTMVLQADYCPPVNGSEPCQRDMLTDEMIETWRIMEKAHRDRKIDTLGVSDFSLTELKKLVEISTEPVSLARARFDPWFRNKQYRAYCRSNKIIFMARSVLGHRWRIEKPELAKERDIVENYYIRRASHQYKTSVHGVVYDWAVRKGVILCPRMDTELHTRVAAQSFRSESKSNPDNLNTIDEEIDPTDTKLFSPGARNYLPKNKKNDKNEGDDDAISNTVEAGEEQMIDSGDLQESYQAQYESMTKSEKDFSNEVYTDNNDFEKFPDFMNIKDPFQ